MRSLLKDPRMGLVKDLTDQRQVVSAKTRGVLPFVPVFVEAGHRHIVAGAVLGLIFPDGRFDAAGNAPRGRDELSRDSLT